MSSGHNCPCCCHRHRNSAEVQQSVVILVQNLGAVKSYHVTHGLPGICSRLPKLTDEERQSRSVIRLELGLGKGIGSSSAVKRTSNLPALASEVSGLSCRIEL